MKIPASFRRRSGFTLIELLVVVTIIGLLFALTVGGFSYAQRSAARSKTSASLAAMKSGLERYKNEFGEYPEPENPGEMVSIVNKNYEVSGAAMLYQALSGDGYDYIRIASPPANAGEATSDGSLDDREAKNVMITDMPKDMWTNKDGRYYMIDGFGRPFQYVKALPAPVNGQNNNAAPVTVNTATYDLWSYGEDEENINARSIETTTDNVLRNASQKWIKNW